MPQKKLLVFGGNGFVGSHVCQEALANNWQVVVACRSGKAVNSNESWVGNAATSFVSVDALSPKQLDDFLAVHSNATAAISTIGLLTLNNSKAKKINGEANVNIFNALAKIKQQRATSFGKAVFISAARMSPAHWILRGYYEGKTMAEAALAHQFQPCDYAVLRPAMIYGQRYSLRLGRYLPLSFMAPLRWALSPLHSLTGFGILTPPVSVKIVAKAAVRAAEIDSKVCGILEDADLIRIGSPEK